MRAAPVPTSRRRPIRRLCDLSARAGLAAVLPVAVFGRIVAKRRRLTTGHSAGSLVVVADGVPVRAGELGSVQITSNSLRQLCDAAVVGVGRAQVS